MLRFAYVPMIVVAATVALLVSAANAELIPTVTRTAGISNGAVAYTLDPTFNLVQAGSTALASVATSYSPYSGYSAIGGINDGVNNVTANSGNLVPSDLLTYYVQFNLNTVAAPQGYAIEGFKTYAYAGDVRKAQEYLVQYQTVSGGSATWYTLESPDHTTDRTSVFQDNWGTGGGNLYGVKWSADENHSEFTIVEAGISGLTGVSALKFTLSNYASGNPGPYSDVPPYQWAKPIGALSEISVKGEAVPEPSTIAMLAAGLLGLLCYAWRKRK